MPDPISVTTTFITLATFIKDLLDLGQSIKRSIDMVRKNSVFISELAEDVPSTLAGLQKLTVGRESGFEAPQLLHALANLKAEMLYVLSKTKRLAPSDGTGLRRLSSKFKAWVRRKDIEADIQNLKEHVNKCYIQFTAFSAARTEYATLRLDNSTLAYAVESSARLHRLEGMMAQLLLGTPFGNTVMQRTAETIASDLSHESLEWKYLSAQTTRLVGSLERLTATNILYSATSLWDPSEALEITFLQPASAIHVLQLVLGMVIETQDAGNEVSVKDLVDDLITLGAYLSMLGMQSEASASEHLTIHFLRSLVLRDDFAGVLPRLIFSLCVHSKRHRTARQHGLALQASLQGIGLCDLLLLQAAPEVDNSPVSLMALLTHADNLRIQGLLEDAIATAEKAIDICRPMLTRIMRTYALRTGRQQLSPEDEWQAAKCCEAFFTLGRALSLAGSYLAAHRSWKEGLERVVEFAGSIPPPRGIRTIFDHLCRMANDGALSLAALADVIALHETLGSLYQRDFTLRFLPVLYAHAYICDHNDPDTSNGGVPFGVGVRTTPPLLSLGISDEFNSLSVSTSLVEKAIVAVYTSSSPPEVVYPISSLIQYFFANDFDHTATVLRRVLKSLRNTPGGTAQIVSFAVAKLSDILPAVGLPHQVIILDVIAELVTHLRAIVCESPKNTDFLLYALWWQFWSLWFAGRLEEALAVTHEAIRSISANNQDSFDWVLDQAFVLFEMGHTVDADVVLEKILPADEGDDDNGFYTFVRSHVLRRMDRNQDALVVLTELSASGANELGSRIVAADLAAVKLSLGQLNPALQCAETAVIVCREEALDVDAVDAKAALIYSLIALSNCLAAVGRHVDGLSASREAAALARSLNEPLVNWPSVVRSTELKANALHAHSLRLLSLAETKEALSNAEDATALYRDLVLLAPRHLGLLSLSLRNLASILWSVGQQEEAIVACKEAVGITRRAVEREKHLLPSLCDVLDQLSAYLDCP
ncbi:hypothetical protein B0H16DRAFT_1719026 [Mycena metata]|uniref:Uncharacterized protein n=1 Tax=Mycena metata TaxID=1033252 RepID=A0AAD7JFD3_9AGAR|nr:hypothetical protein B0H16DRAFT_1719026 [Mycena metata]